MNSKTTENIAAKTDLKLTTPNDREIAMTRAFDAPRSQVFDALTRPEVLKRYFATPGWSLVVCEVDLKPGGAYRYVWRSNDGAEMGMGGVYRESLKIPNAHFTQSSIKSRTPQSRSRCLSGAAIGNHPCSNSNN